jgi:hypothetical protein
MVCAIYIYIILFLHFCEILHQEKGWCFLVQTGADTLKFNLHIIGRAKKGCEFNEKRYEFKIFQNLS